MADARTDGTGIQLGFWSKGLERKRQLSLHGVRGREEISRLFEFDLLLSGSADEPLHEDELLALGSEPCVIAMGPRKSDVVHGLIARVEHVDGARATPPRYVARLVPAAWLLSIGRRSSIHQDVTILELAAALFGQYGFAALDFELRADERGKGTKHEYIVQYQESDWDFLQRWLEREGYFYWFEHREDRTVLVVGDENEDAPDSVVSEGGQGVPLPFRERSNLTAPDERTGSRATVWDVRVVQQRVPARVTLVDYNYRRPLDMLVTSAEVDPMTGFGHVVQYGEHFKDTRVGATRAEVRAQELMVPRRTIRARTDSARVRAGHVFELEGHFVPSYDGKYLVTSVEHAVGLDPAAFLTRGAEEGSSTSLVPYSASLQAIPAGVPYRASQRTPWPRIHGIVSGHIEAAGNGDYADLDDQGRYKVKMTFDVSPSGAATSGHGASRRIRMAQGYAGAGYGTHHPLHRGAEVLIAHVDGDPDRPVIVGSVPNPVTVSPVTSMNATQSVTSTASGIRITQEDRESRSEAE